MTRTPDTQFRKSKPGIRERPRPGPLFLVTAASCRFLGAPGRPRMRALGHRLGHLLPHPDQEGECTSTGYVATQRAESTSVKIRSSTSLRSKGSGSRRPSVRITRHGKVRPMRHRIVVDPELELLTCGTELSVFLHCEQRDRKWVAERKRRNRTVRSAEHTSIGHHEQRTVRQLLSINEPLVDSSGNFIHFHPYIRQCRLSNGQPTPKLRHTLLNLFFKRACQPSTMRARRPRCPPSAASTAHEDECTGPTKNA